MVRGNNKRCELICVVVDRKHRLNARDVCIDLDGFKAHTVLEYFLTYDSNGIGEREAREACALERLVADLNYAISCKRDARKNSARVECALTDVSNACGNGEGGDSVGLECEVGNFNVA